MANVADFRSLVRLSISNAPNAVVDNSLVRAARKFCKRSKAIREDLAPVDSEVDTALYTLVPPTDAEVIDIEEVLYEGRKLTAKSHKDLSKMDPEYRTRPGTPNFYVFEGSNQIRIVGVPTAAVVGAIEAKAIVQPLPSATTVHDDLYDMYSESIAEGALAILFNMVSQPWYNPGMAAQSKAVSENDADEARVRAGMSNTKGASGKVKYGGL